MSKSEQIIKSIEDADEIEILEFDFEPCFHRLRNMETLLKEAAELFRVYEDSHRRRGVQHLEKAERNAEIAARIEAVLHV